MPMNHEIDFGQFYGTDADVLTDCSPIPPFIDADPVVGFEEIEPRKRKKSRREIRRERSTSESSSLTKALRSILILRHF